MIANYHTHSSLCRHAVGTEEEYVLRAVESGVQTLGFSDHAPYPFGDDFCSKIRMYLPQLPEYVQRLEPLRRQYEDRIKLHIGLEAEFYPAHFADFLEMVRDQGIEYLILGQHFLGNERNEVRIYKPFAEEARLERYCDQSIEGMQTGVFTYFAHPDLPGYLGDDKSYGRHMRRLVREAMACGLPLEINLHGARLDCTYPDVRFWRIAAEENAAVVLGRDAHDPNEFLDTQTEARMLAMVRELGLKLLDEVTLIKP